MTSPTNSTEAALSGPFGLLHDAWGRLVLIDREGQRHAGVDVSRAFPYTDPLRWIVLRSSEGRELACIENLDELAPATRQVLEAELANRDFTPVVRRILKVTSQVDPTYWHVETDRGDIEFAVNSEDDIRRFGPHRALIVDSQGIRFLIPDIRELDTTSRRILELYL